MADRMVLVLDDEERGAIARDLRRYGVYRERVGADLWDAHVLPEPGEPDPPGISAQVEAMADSHFAVAGECESLAAAFESDAPVSLTLPSIRLIEETVSDAYADGLPPEVARTAMFCRVARCRLADSAGPDEAVAVNAEPQPLATERFALALAQRLEEVNAALSTQLAELRTRQDALNERLKTQQEEIAQLRDRGGKRRQRPNLFTSAFEPAGQTRRRPETGRGRSL